MNDFCHDLEVIPQFTGTCWFNAILMISLYSSGVSRFIREVAIRDNWRKSDDGFKVAFYNILSYINRIRLNPNNKEKRDEINKKLNEYLFKVKPEILLLDLIERKDKKLKDFFISVNKDLSKKINLSLNFIYIISFFKVLNINFIDIYCDLYNNYNVLDMNHDIKTEDEMEEKLKSNPDVIIYTDSLLSSSDYLGEDYEYDEIYDTNTYNLNINDLKKYKEIIRFNETNYKLDSVLISNYNNEIYKHAIAGITCNNNKYVYNGWTTKTTDPVLREKIDKLNESACSLMKYDWNLRKSQEFCLNPYTCKIEFDIKSSRFNNICFSFTKGNRILVYVRITDDIERLFPTSLSRTSINISKTREEIFNRHIEEINSLSISSSSSKSISKSINEYHSLLTEIIDNNIRIPNEVLMEIPNKTYYNIYGKKNKLGIAYVREIVITNHKIKLLQELSLEQLRKIVEIYKSKSLSSKSSLLSINSKRQRIIRKILSNKNEFVFDMDENIILSIYYHLLFKKKEELDKIKTFLISNNDMNIIKIVIFKELNETQLNEYYHYSYQNKEFIIKELLKRRILITPEIIKMISNEQLIIIYSKIKNILIYMDNDNDDNDNNHKKSILELLNQDELKEILYNYFNKNNDYDNDELIKIIIKEKITPFLYLNNNSNMALFIRINNKRQELEDIIDDIDYSLFSHTNDKLKRNELNKLPLDLLNEIYIKLKT